ncbi:MAG: hypothetical protein QXK88_06510 [Desulfurococcaceae archaeon]
MEGGELVSKLEEAIDLVDKIEGFISRVKPGDQIAPGLIYQIYESLVLLREKIVEARMVAASR